MICLGLDPGTSNPGLCIIVRMSDGWHLCHRPVLHSLEDLEYELAHLGHVDCCAYEDVAWALHRKRQGCGSGRILESVGIIKMFAAMRRIPCVQVAPNQWRKRVAGTAKASKRQVREVLSRTVHGWPKRQMSLNRSDAIAIAIAGAMMPGVITCRK